MAIVNLKPRNGNDTLKRFLDGASIEVMPRTAAKIDDFRALLPQGTRVYVANIEGTPFEDMLATAKRLSAEGFAVMPHVPARLVPDAATLDRWLGRYADEAGVSQALVLAGGPATQVGAFDSSMQLMETGLFQKHGYSRLHVAGHPEGNKDIDPDGATANVDAALLWKQRFAEEAGIDMAIVTQFAFAAQPVVDWAERLAALGVTLPIHVGVAGPAKLQTLIKYAIACGVGPSLGVLQKRAKDITKLLKPFEPTELLTELAGYAAAHPESLIKAAHVFPLGGIAASADYIAEKTGA
jgi:methylenetetrahydrofolate reductase (NADPH)